LERSSYNLPLSGYSADAIVTQVNRDSPLATQTIIPALTELDKQMRENSDSIQRPTTTQTVTAWASNLGDTELKCSLTNEYGDPLDLVFAEDINVEVTADSGNGGTKWAETLTITGEPGVLTTSHLWPLGSAASTTMAVVDPETTGFLTDGGLETWGSTGNNTPTYWLAGAGAFGTDIFRESSNVLRGDYAAKLLADGSTLVSLRQAVELDPNTVYGVVAFVKASATDGSGIFRIRLTNGSGTVLTDDAGNNLQVTADMASTISTSDFTTVTAFFSTPRQLPDTVYFQFGYSVSPTSGKSLYVDCVNIEEATQAYTGGPYLYAVSREANSAQGDYWTVAITSNATTNNIARSLDRLFSLRTNGIYLKSAASPTVADTLITS
jgi:hypothetical protein